MCETAEFSGSLIKNVKKSLHCLTTRTARETRRARNLTSNMGSNGLRAAESSKSFYSDVSDLYHRPRFVPSFAVGLILTLMYVIDAMPMLLLMLLQCSLLCLLPTVQS